MGCKLEQTLNLINFSEDNLFSAFYSVIINQNFEVLLRKTEVAIKLYTYQDK